MNQIVEVKPQARSLGESKGFDLSPRTFEQALTFAGYLADSEMVPKQFRGKPGDCLIAMQWGYELNLKPLQAMQSIAVVNGKPSLYGDAGKAVLLAAGCQIEEDDTAVVQQNKRGRCKITRAGRPPVERTFSEEDAKRAGLLNKDGPWKSYPYRQMAWRAFWFAARDAAADILRGMIGAEEAADIVPGALPSAAPVAERVDTPPTWPADAFAKQFPRWSKAVESGLKSADDILAMAQTKGALTPEQEAQIRALKPKAADPEPAADARADDFAADYDAAEGGAQ